MIKMRQFKQGVQSIVNTFPRLQETLFRRNFNVQSNFYSTVAQTEAPSITKLSKKSFNLKDHRHYQKMLLANTKFYCLDKPLLGIRKDGSVGEWALLPSLKKEEFDPKVAFEVKEDMDVFDELDKAHHFEAAFERFHDSLPEDSNLEIHYVHGDNPNTESLASLHQSNPNYFQNPDHHPLIHQFQGNSEEAVERFLNKVLKQIHQPINKRSALRFKKNGSKLHYRLTSVLRKRRLKMNKHKYKKLRKRTRALRKRLNK